MRRFVILHLIRGILPIIATSIWSQAAQADLSQDIDAVLPDAVSAYTYLHEHPELGKQETLAFTYLREQLSATGSFSFMSVPSLPTALIAVLDSGKPGPVIALRAELDARPLGTGEVEPADHNPRSQIDGLMHSCGHDLHAAILLGAAKLAAAHRDRFSGKIVFLFQPAEETPGGADDIVRLGILKDLGVQSIFALHSAPGMAVGTIGISAGPSLAGSNYFTLTLKGAGSHAAAPYEGSDIPVISAQFVQALSYLPARRIDLANRPVIISITRLISESGASNVIPDSAELKGTIRAFEILDAKSNENRSLESIIVEQINGLAQANRISAEWSLRKGSPPTINDEGLFEKIVPALKLAWHENVDLQQRRGMFSEDFAYYTPETPALYFSLGVAKDGLGSGFITNR